MKDIDSPSPAKNGTVTLVFKVWAPDFNRVNHRLFLLGSLKELGAWNINDSVEAFPTPDLHVWKAEVTDVPPKSSFEWVWLKTKSDRTVVQWERSAKRNRTIDNFSGIIHSVYGEGIEVFQQTATSVEISTFLKVEEGQVLVLTGDSPSTGMWDLALAVKAREYPQQSGYWKALVSFDAYSTLSFKWAVVREKDRKLQVMEKHNHCIYGRPSSVRAVAPWSLPRIFIVDTNIANDPLDNMTGRTDLIVSERKMRNEEIRKWINTGSPSGKTPSLFPLSHVPIPKNPKSHSSPTTTDKDMAQTAIYQMTNKAVLLPSQTQSPPLRKPTVQPLTDIDEHSKQRQKAMTRTQRLTKQFNKEYKGSDAVDKIKGSGQSDAAKESGEACDWLQQFPWALEVATADEAKFLVYRCEELESACDEPKTRLASTRQAFTTKIEMETHATSLKNKLCDAGVSSLKEGDDDFGHNIEDSGLESLSQTPTVQKSHSSVTTATEIYSLGYDLIVDDFNEIMSQSLEIPGFQTSIVMPGSDITNMDMSLAKNESPLLVSEISDLGGSSVDPSVDEDVRTVNSMIKSIKCSKGLETGIDCLYLDWLTEKVNHEESYGIELTKVFHEDDISSTGNWKEETNAFDENTTEKRQRTSRKNKASITPIPEIADQIFAGTKIPRRQHGSFSRFNQPDIEQRRQVALILEEQWGSGAAHTSSANAIFQNLHLGPSERKAACNFMTYQIDGSGDLVLESEGTRKGIGYTNLDLMNVMAKPSKRVNHRAIARMLEERWGDMSAAGTGSTLM